MSIDTSTMEYYDNLADAKKKIVEKQNDLAELVNKLIKMDNDKKKLNDELSRSWEKCPSKPHLLDPADSRQWDEYINKGKEYVVWRQQMDQDEKNIDTKIEKIRSQIREIVPEIYHAVEIKISKSGRVYKLRLNAKEITVLDEGNMVIAG